jgi:PAS domain S-box-containing protein
VAMNEFYGNQLSQQELHRQLSQQQTQQQHHDKMSMNGQGLPGNQAGLAMSSALDDSPMIGGESLDEIIRSNHQEMQRRRSSIPQLYGNQMTQDEVDRRISMVEFGNETNDFRNFQFDGNAMSSGFVSMGGNMAMPGYGQQNMMIGEASDFSGIAGSMMGNMMSSTFANMSMGQMGADSMDIYSTVTNPPQYRPPPVNTSVDDFMDLNVQAAPPSATPSNARSSSLDDQDDDNDDDMMTVTQSFAPTSSHPESQRQSGSLDGMSGSMPQLAQNVSSTPSYQSSTLASTQATPQASTAQSAASVAPTSTSPATPRTGGEQKNIYSKSGFDMVKALWYVGARKNPEIHLGSVDFSCAFVVCDITMNDCPIIYVSDNFQNLTGYSRHEIVGQNCRFLQAPDGKVEAGAKREFVDDAAVYALKQKIAEKKEVQQSLINYRKGGKPFLNLLTMIPIPWDTDEIRFFVGFQIDLVECPDAIESGQDPGAVLVNYKHSDIGQYIWTPPSSAQWEPVNGQTLHADDVSTLLQQCTTKGTVSDIHKQSWDKMLLENSDDVVHVLSLKGLFLYLSPSCRRVLEYDVAELVGNSLSTVCHPSDIVPVTRELKDTAAGNTVNIVFRIRRKESGYTWFESHGSLFVEQGKGRKCIILVGRRRPVFSLSRRELEAHGGIGDSELWTKVSTSGMLLYVSSNIRSLLDLQPENLVGTSLQDLMRKESRAEFGRSIEKARRGKTVTCKHEMQNRRGQVLQAQTTLYPGDAVGEEKPTFLLAQTKLLKASSRNNPQATTPNPSLAAELPFPGGATEQTADAGAIGGSLPTSAGGVIVSSVQENALATVDDNIFDELRTTKCSSWQYELRQMEKVNRILAEELVGLLSNKKKRKRRKGVGNAVRDCANCHTRNTPEWRRGPSGQRDLCNSCGLRWAKQVSLPELGAGAPPSSSSPGSSAAGGEGEGGAGAGAGAGAGVGVGADDAGVSVDRPRIAAEFLQGRKR